MSRRHAPLAALLPCLALLAATRIPGPAWAVAASAALLAAALPLAVLAVRERPPRWAGAALTAALLLLLAIPPSLHAWGAAVPALVPAASALLALHLLHEHPQAEAPRIGAHGGARLARWLPVAALLLLVAAVAVALPWLLPDRLASSLDLRGAALPLLAALAVAVPVLVAVGLRHARRRGREEDA